MISIFMLEIKDRVRRDVITLFKATKLVIKVLSVARISVATFSLILSFLTCKLEWLIFGIIILLGSIL